MNLQNEMTDRVTYIEEVIKKYLPAEEGLQKSVIQAMNYSLLAGGKRLRPMLMQESYRMFGGENIYRDSERGKLVEPFMAAMEMIHTYSLVHDDLPAMDNDEYRRGRKTTHVVYGEAMAILAGDGLLNFAFETACKAFREAKNPEEYARVGRAMEILAGKAGVYGMLGGQVADVEAEEKDTVSSDTLLFIHENKTAAMIESCLMIGAVLAGAEEDEVRLLEKAGSNIGVAFQIQDDILDITSTLEVLGKPIGSDEKNHKQTYVSIHGMEQSKADVKRLSEEAITILASFQRRNEYLEQLVEQLISRKK
ncbi:MAG: polyprenyl synthetase family protein [Lachnospiraceae bacterium]|nr:polyprenyl synthetase family protein [Lachnospiraceae bacterium]